MFAGVALLLVTAACSGSTFVPSTADRVNDAVRPSTERSWLLAPGDTTQPTIYVSSPYAQAVNIYNAGRQIGALIGFQYPTGLYIASNGDLYVVNQNGQDVLVFPRGATKPSKTLNDSNQYPVGAVVGPDGTVYVSNYSGTISVFAHGKRRPTATLTDPLALLGGPIGVDGHGNLYWGVASIEGGGFVDEFIAGAKKPKRLGIAYTLGGAVIPNFADLPGTIQIAKNGDLVLTQLVNLGNGCCGTWIDTYPPKQNTPVSSLYFEQVAISAATLNAGNTQLWVANVTTGAVDQLTYPQGRTISVNSFGLGLNYPPDGIAVDAPSQRATGRQP